MTVLTETLTLPEFELEAHSGGRINRAELLGNPCVIYFYPKDSTPGCTREAQDFTGLAAQFKSLGVRVIGVSRDSIASHQRFAGKHELEITLLSDPDALLCNALGVIGEKTLYGKKHIGLIRSTFLFDARGELVKAWRNVRVPGHAQTVLEHSRALKA